jgi:hypothetical protein
LDEGGRQGGNGNEDNSNRQEVMAAMAMAAGGVAALDE